MKFIKCSLKILFTIKKSYLYRKESDTPVIPQIPNTTLKIMDAMENVEIKLEKIDDIVEVDEEIFTHDDNFVDEFEELDNVSCGEHFNAFDNQFIIKEDIICKEEPKFCDLQTDGEYYC